jgi:site-specific DNA-adenine methylase
VEPFCGGAWVYFTKPPSKVEILNDFDGELVNFWKVVRHHLPEFLRYLEFTLVSREEFKAEQKLDPACECIRKYDSPKTFFYIDPPYWNADFFAVSFCRGRL